MKKVDILTDLGFWDGLLERYQGGKFYVVHLCNDSGWLEAWQDWDSMREIYKMKDGFMVSCVGVYSCGNRVMAEGESLFYIGDIDMLRGKGLIGNGNTYPNDMREIRIMFIKYMIGRIKSNVNDGELNK